MNTFRWRRSSRCNFVAVHPGDILEHVFDILSNQEYFLSLIVHDQTMGNSIGIRLAGMNSLLPNLLCSEESKPQNFDKGDDVLCAIGGIMMPTGLTVFVSMISMPIMQLLQRLVKVTRLMRGRRGLLGLYLVIDSIKRSAKLARASKLRMPRLR